MIMNDNISTRFKIINELLEKKEPLNLTAISKNLKLDKELVFHHLKNLKEEYIVAETDDKEYVLQSIFYDENVMEILDSGMKSIVLTILRELKNTEYEEEQLIDAVRNNLQVYIENFAIEIN